MSELSESQVAAWLRGWQRVEPIASDEVSSASAHAQVRALDHAVKALRLDDEPWRLRVRLSRSQRP
ncbi:MAG: hypothetical protein AAFX81_10275 [Pseudomonadota bacterium]